MIKFQKCFPEYGKHDFFSKEDLEFFINNGKNAIPFYNKGILIYSGGFEFYGNEYMFMESILPSSDPEKIMEKAIQMNPGREFVFLIRSYSDHF